jgi:hypothetical protein
LEGIGKDKLSVNCTKITITLVVPLVKESMLRCNVIGLFGHHCDFGMSGIHVKSIECVHVKSIECNLTGVSNFASFFFPSDVGVPSLD